MYDVRNGAGAMVDDKVEVVTQGVDIAEVELSADLQSGVWSGVRDEQPELLCQLAHGDSRCRPAHRSR